MANKTENRRVNLYINGKEVKNSLKGIQAEYKKLIAEQNSMIRGTKEYQAHAKKISKLKTIMNQHYQAVNKTAGAWGSLQRAANGVNKYFMVISAGIATLTGLVMAFRKAADAANEFEERVDNLSALTGLEGDPLGWLSDKAKETSVAILESGIRIKQSASDIVDAYTKMGSQRPELLQNKEALHEVTLNAIILSEAAKGKLEPAVAALATTLNQFNLSARDSERTINVISAGSKAGAGNIGYLSEAIEKAGTTMALLGMEVEDGVAIVETVAPKFAKASQAGNSLDKVFLKMRSLNIGFKDGVFDLNLALDELRVRFGKGEKAVDIFSERHAKMVEVMVQGQSEFNRYRGLVTDTNIAMEQAIKNTDNRATQLAQARNKITLLAIELGENLSPTLTKAYLGFGMLMKVTMALPKIFKENKTLIIALTGAYLAYNSAKIATIALNIKENISYAGLIAMEKIRFVLGTKGLVLTNARAIASRLRIALTGKMTIAQGRSIVAQKTLNATMKANPLGLVLLGITALIAGIRLYNKYNSKTLELERKKADLSKDLTTLNKSLEVSYKGINDEIGKLNRLSFQEKLDLQSKIDETIRLAEAKIELAKVQRQEIRNSFDPTLWDEFIAGGKSMWIELTKGSNAGQQAVGDIIFGRLEERKNDATKDIDQFIKDVQASIENIKNSSVSLTDILLAEQNADNIGTQTLVNLEEKLNLYQLALRNAVKGSEDYHRIQKKILDTEKLAADFAVDYNTEEEVKAAENLAKEKLRVEQQLQDSIAKLRQAIRINGLSGQDKEIQQVQDKYADLFSKANEYGLDIMALTDLREQELNAIVVKWAQKTKEEKEKAQADINLILMSDRETAIHETTKKYQDLIKLAEEHGLETTELYQAMNDELARIKNETFSDEDGGGDSDIFGMSAEDWDETLQHIAAAIQIAQQFGEIWSSVNARKTAEEDYAMQNYEDNMIRRQKLLKDQLDAGIISQEHYDRQVDSLNDQMDKKKKDLAIKQWKRDKQLRLFTANINTAAGITQALGSTAPPYSFILAALTAVLGGIQIAAIKSEPTPVFKYGGYTPDRATMAIVGDDNKKEWVASGDLVEDPKTGPIIQQLEDYQKGRTKSVHFSTPVQPDIQAISASAAPRFTSAGQASYYANQDSEILMAIHQQMQQMNEKNSKMNEYLSDPKNRRASISYDHQQEYANELSDIQALSRSSS